MLFILTAADQTIPPFVGGFAEGEALEGAAVTWRDKPVRACILIIEDNPGDVFIMEEAIREHDVECTVTNISNGEEAISFFDRLDQDFTATCPSIVLLDLNLPKHSGHSVLSRIRASVRCPAVPVVIVSSSEAESDLLAIRQQGATAYFRKPNKLDEFMKLGGLVNSLLSN